jgi:Flp pilus assembly protein CpaB
MQNILSSRLLSTRGGTVVLGAIAALLAAIILLVYLNRYRESVSSSSAPQTVLVAKSLIPKGTSGALVGQKELFQSATLPGDQIKEGAVTDPATLKGKVAADDIFPGQQITTADFSATATDAVATQITGPQRAISIAIDEAHGNIGQLVAGDHIDVWAGMNVVPPRGDAVTPVVTLIAADILVMAAPGAGSNEGVGGGDEAANVVLRLNNTQAAKVAFAADNGRLWFMLRPRSSSTPTRPKFADVESLLIGVTPLRTKERAK